MKELTKKKKINFTPWIFISPWIIGFLIFTAMPLLFSLIMSFFNWPVIGQKVFVGFQNYITMFTKDAQFYKSLFITLKFALIFVPFNLIIALILAVMISIPVRGVYAYRVIFYLPTVVSGVAVSIIWGWILNGQYGVFNYILSFIGISGPDWLNNPSWAIVAIVIAGAWGVGTMMLIFYTAIKAISKDLYEAAYIDGASNVRSFFSITLPLITPTLLFNLVTSIITSLQEITLVLLLTNGGPMKSTYFYGLYVFNNAFVKNRLGYACANAWFMFLIILLLTALVFKSSDVWVYNAAGKNKKRSKTS
ncbi:sugar ABC transporter permease [Caproiciproducens galactitolivorans]|uniref:Lactose transport system permease protein LacF n=1 Tax=Caproiciproducens galactitolivorans TaxID=642589 RepID=A0A4Z0YJG4_9FIRM|nr:sugar ABC transporter permease [Caproiciproducens galactitolivorans]QEY34446.1 sugar ABC transporter permease [Caproiciproducens galactitolivorans]TGJ77776.1 lactose transport system permease protein LacF [Caproiciproducens galactitolivorans]